MTLVVANVGDQNLLSRILNKTPAGDVKLHLFTNNVAPGKTDTVATYTELAGVGYAAISLAAASWSIATVGNVTTATYPQQTFALSGPATIYGYYVTDAAGTTLLWAEAFAAPIVIPAIGGGLMLTPTITGN